MTATTAAKARPSAGDRIRAALWFAERGFGVFTVWSTTDKGICRCPLGKTCDNAGKHPITPKGFHDATLDPARITTLLSAGSEPNYGLVCPDGVFALDVDGDGVARLAELEAAHGPLPPTLRTSTAHGEHIFLRWPDDAPRPIGQLFGFVTRWGSGANAGYVIGPRSVHASGAVYAPAGDAFEIAEIPPYWAAAAIAGKAPAAAPPGAIVIEAGGYVLPERVAASESRYEAIRAYTAHLYNRGVTIDEMWPLVVSQLAPLFEQSLSEPELRSRFQRTTEKLPTRLGEPAAVVSITPTGEVVREAPVRQGRIYAEDIELALPAVQPFPDDPDPVAFDGLAGEAIGSLEGLTSASRVGMLATLLAAWGGLFGTRTTYHGEQPSVLFSVLVGETGRARKGTTTSAVWTGLSHALTSGFIAIPISANRWDGLASGEALVRTLAEAKGNDPTKPVFGLIVEEEFERLLRRMRSSEGYQSTLDVYLRQAFDARMIQHLTAAKSLRVQPPYGVSILGNVTRETLRQNVSPEMARSGFANRFLWIPIREREVAIAGSAAWHFAEAIQGRLRDARVAWSGGGHLELVGSALDLLNDYAAHLRGLQGLVGAMSARLHVIAARVALVHAALEQRAFIGRDLVERAIALTEYARRGLGWSFRDDVGDEDANTLYAAVLDRFVDGLSTREAQAVVGRPQRFLKARDLLLESGYLRLQTDYKPTTNRHEPNQTSSGGRPSKRLFAADPVVFQAFVPRAGAHATPPIETEIRGSGDSLVENRIKPTTNRLQSESNQSIAGPLSETDALTLVRDDTPEPPPVATWCHYFGDHQSRHRDVQTNAPWCEICTPREVAS